MAGTNGLGFLIPSDRSLNDAGLGAIPGGLSIRKQLGRQLLAKPSAICLGIQFT